jgi:hypothetical protein
MKRGRNVGFSRRIKKFGEQRRATRRTFCHLLIGSIVWTGLTGQDYFPLLLTKAQAVEIGSLALIKLLIGV